MKILIVDDSVELRQRLVKMLSELPEIKVIGQAKDTAEAIESISSLRPDSVILDIRMPVGSGIDVLKKIKRDYPSVRVIMCTNYPTAQYRKRCLDLGADYFFDKSAEFENIARIIRQLTQNIK
jgi:DNA-binding NarL/FixJ family response regulator